MNNEHADLEALSAYVDGEAPEWADHVAGCDACRASAEALGTVAAAVGVPVDGPDPRVREAAIHAALGDFEQRHAAERRRFAGRRSEWQLNFGAVAAVLVAVLALSAILYTSRTGTEDATTVAGPALESAPKADRSVALPPTDLGDVPDAATLAARVRPALPASAGAATAESGSARSSANSGAPALPAPVPAGGTSVFGNPTASGGAGGAGSGLAATGDPAGIRSCEAQARAREPALRDVVYYATARRGQTPAVVLGFTTGPTPTPVTLLLLAQDGCAELLRAVAP